MISAETGGTPPEIDGRKRVCKMSEYQLKTPKKVEEAVVGTYHKIEDTVVGTCQKIEDTVVGAYKKVEAGAVGSYKKVEKKFVDTFLELKDSGTQEGARHDTGAVDKAKTGGVGQILTKEKQNCMTGETITV